MRRNRLTSFSILNVPKMTGSSLNKDTNRMTSKNVFIANQRGVELSNISLICVVHIVCLKWMAFEIVCNNGGPSFSPENNHWQKCSVGFGPANTNSFFPHVWQTLSLSTPWSIHFKHTICTTQIRLMLITETQRAPHITNVRTADKPWTNEWEIIPVETSIARLVMIIIHLDTSVTCYLWIATLDRNYDIRCCKRVLLLVL
jgi:hypothetical protein